MMYPEPFLNRIKEQFPNEWQDILAHMEHDPVSSIRINTKKTLTAPIHSEPIPWCSKGFFLDKRPQFTLDPLFHAGTYYVQEASSMYLDYILNSLKTTLSLDRVLDLCAAPGGKSTLILDHLNPSQFLISNEIVENRNTILRENLTKWGVPNFVVTQNEAIHFSKLTSFFDLILIDAPCSGEGMFRKDPKTIEHWSQKNLDLCATRQEQILLDIWDSLKPDGVLIYSTCTFNPDENENLLNHLKSKLDFECIEMDIEENWNIHTVIKDSIVGYQFLPHRVKGEGFFCSILRKKSGTERNYTSKVKLSNLISKNLLDPSYVDDYSEMEHNNGIFICTNQALIQIEALKKHLYIKQVGIEIGKKIRDKFIEDHGVATLYNLDASKFKIIELELYQALQFLSKEVFDTSMYSDGIYLVRYKEVPIGLLKQIGNRHNNYYPKNWRILMNWKLSLD